MSQHIFSIKANFIVFAILMVLMLATVGAAYLDLGWIDIPVALTIAFTKMIIIMLYFMHLRYSTNLTMIIAGAGFLWLILLVAFLIADFHSRDWLRSPSADGIEYFGQGFATEPQPQVMN
ncbi:hypothetical protein BH23PLA1_BH23PLA1_24050 [soil metagenome]